MTYGFVHVILCDKVGILSKGMDGLNWMQEKMVEVTNLEHITRTLADALKGADIFVGVSAPGIFKGSLEGRAAAITEEMKLAAAAAIAGLVAENELSDENILPAAFDPRVADAVSMAVKKHIK